MLWSKLIYVSKTYPRCIKQIQSNLFVTHHFSKKKYSQNSPLFLNWHVLLIGMSFVNWCELNYHIWILSYQYNTFHSLTHWGWVTHICVSNLIVIGSLVNTKPLSKPMPEYCYFDTKAQNSMKFLLKFIYFHSRKCICMENGDHFVLALMY